MTTRAAIYARVSSAAQREAQTIEGQLRTLPPFVKSQGWTLTGTYVDDGRSAKTGALDRREGFAKLMRDAEARRFDVLVVVDVNRLTRTNSIEERAEILGPFQRLGIAIATPSGGVLDLRSFLGEFWVTVQALVAAEENRKRAEAIVRGKGRAMANGTNPSGPVPYGYRYSKDTKQTLINEDEAAIVREIYERLAKGHTGSQIAADFNRRHVPQKRASAWQGPRIYQLARRTAYRGEWLVDVRRKITIPVPPIVSAELWHRVRERPQAAVRRGAAATKKRHEYLIESLATCALCGGRIGIASGFRRSANCVAPNRYVCMGRRQPTPGLDRCALPYFEARELDERVWAAVASLALDPKRLERIAREHQETATQAEAVWLDDARDAEKRLAKIESTQAAIVSRFSRGLISETVMDDQLERLQADRVQAKHQLDTANRARFSAARGAARGVEIAELTRSLRKRAAETSLEKRRELVRALVRPLGIVLSVAEVVLDVRIKRPAVSPSFASVGSLEHSDTITIRLVA